MRADIIAGAVFPDYELTDHRGKRRKLSDLRCVQNLQWLLVFWPPDYRRASARLACCAEEIPSGLGHRQARAESRLGTGRTRSLLSLWQDLRAGISGARIIGERNR